MKRKLILLIAATLVIVAGMSYAGDVVYTLWEDDEGQFWVRIQNDTDNRIRVESIFIVYYNEKGKPVEQRSYPCTGNCRLSPHDTRDFGPYSPPAGTASARVRNVKYSVE